MPPLKPLDLFNTQRVFCHLAVAHSAALRLNIRMIFFFFLNYNLFSGRPGRLLTSVTEAGGKIDNYNFLARCTFLNLTF